jgi:hypothetical protein
MRTAAEVLAWLGFAMCSAWLVLPLLEIARAISSIDIRETPHHYVAWWVESPFFMLFLHGIIVLLIALILAIRSREIDENKREEKP